MAFGIGVGFDLGGFFTILVCLHLFLLARAALAKYYHFVFD